MQCVKQSNPHSLERKFFPRYVDGIVRTVKGDPEELLNAANQLHPNLQFSLELSLSCNNPNVNTHENVISGGYQKLIDTGTTLNFRSCALLHYKKNTKKAQLIEHLEGLQLEIFSRRPWRLIESNGRTTNTQKFLLIKLFQGRFTDLSKEKSTRALAWT